MYTSEEIMKKTLVLAIILFFNTAFGMYHRGSKLKYDEITLINKSSGSLEIAWNEIGESQSQTITKEIPAGETIVVKIGEIGGYDTRNPARIIVRPLSYDKSFTQDHYIDLPNSKAFAFTAVTMAKLLKNILVPLVFAADDAGHFNTFTFMDPGLTRLSVFSSNLFTKHSLIPKKPRPN